MTNLTLCGNNKGNLESWGEYLTRTHIFADSFKVSPLTHSKTKYRFELYNCSQDARVWILANFNAKKPAPNQKIANWYREFKAAPIAPKYRVQRNLDRVDYETYDYQDALETYDLFNEHPRTFRLILWRNDDVIKQRG